MALTQPSLIPQPWGSDGQVGNIPQDSSEFGKASWAKGFPAETAQPLTEGGIPPSYLDFQGVLNALSAHAVFMQSGAHYAWNSSLDYPEGCFVLGSDSKLYQALQASGPGYSAGAKNPTSNAGYWSPVPLASDVAAAQAAAESTAASLYLPLSGGTMTGSLNVASSNIDIEVTPATDQYGNWLMLVDKNGKSLGGIRAVQYAEGHREVQFSLVDSNGNAIYPIIFSLKTDGKRVINFVNTVAQVSGNPVLTSADSATIAGYAMPSGRYTDLTLGATESSYTAPANGYYFIQKKTNAAGQYFWLQNTTKDIALSSTGYGGGATLLVLMPAQTGDVVKVIYNAGGDLSAFRFYYTEGAK